MSHTTMNNSLSIAKAIFVYEKLLKDGKIKKDGAAYKRLEYFRYLKYKGYRKFPSNTRQRLLKPDIKGVVK